MADEFLHIETMLLHGAHAAEETTGATVPPLFQTTAFARKSAEELESVFAGRSAGYVYTRLNNPTLDGFERRVTALEEGLASVSCASGMAAISTTVLALAGCGDEVICGNSLFGGTYSLFAVTLKRYGIRARFVNATDVDSYREAVTDATRLIFVETIGNPKLDVPNISAISKLARQRGIVLVVDSTVTTPVLIQPKKHGADVVIHSTSKFINGHGNAIGGIIVDSGSFDWLSPRYSHLKPFVERVGQFAFLAALRNRVHRDLGGCLSPFNAFLMSMGIESLALRMERQCTNALAVSEWLVSNKRIESVRYPGLKSHAEYETARRQFGQRYGALLTIRLGTKQRCFRFINALQRAQNVANLGDSKTLVIHPGSTMCRDASEEERENMGVTDDLVRMSIGIEHIDDIIADIDQALAKAE